MELANKFKRMLPVVKKYRYFLLAVIIGLAFLLIPVSNDSDKIDQVTQSHSDVQEQSVEERLSEILCFLDGAGDVRVILSVAAGEEVVFQTDLNHNSSDSSENIKHDTVTITSADRSTTGLVKQVIPEIFKGAVVICSGADDPVVRLSIVDAVSKLTGLGANQISVLKMK